MTGYSRALSAVIKNVAVWAIVFVVVFPLLWMISTSLRPEREIFARPPPLLPSSPTLEHFLRLLRDTPFPTYFLNSVIVSVATTCFVIVVATFGAYSVARFRYPGRHLLSRLILFTYLLPSVVLVLPLYLLLSKFGLVNSLVGLIIVYVTFALPFSLWLLRSFIADIPRDLEAAAMVDGASRMGAFFEVILPQALPGIISTALFTFILTWNEYLYALVFLSRDSIKTLPPGVITMLTSAYNIEWTLLMAASVMMSIPLVLSFAFLQKYLTRGFGAGAVKG